MGLVSWSRICCDHMESGSSVRTLMFLSVLLGPSHRTGVISERPHRSLDQNYFFCACTDFTCDDFKRRFRENGSPASTPKMTPPPEKPVPLTHTLRTPGPKNTKHTHTKHNCRVPVDFTVWWCEWLTLLHGRVDLWNCWGMTHWTCSCPVNSPHNCTCSVRTVPFSTTSRLNRMY